LLKNIKKYEELLIINLSLLWFVAFVKLVFGRHPYFRLNAFYCFHTLSGLRRIVTHLERLLSCVLPSERRAKFVWCFALGWNGVLQIHRLQGFSSCGLGHFLIVGGLLSRRPKFRWLLLVRTSLAHCLWMLHCRRLLRVNAQFLHRLAHVLVFGRRWRRENLLHHTPILLVKRTKEGQLPFLRRLWRAWQYLGLQSLRRSKRLVRLPALHVVLIFVKVEVASSSQFCIRNILFIEFLLVQEGSLWRWTLCFIHLQTFAGLHWTLSWRR